MKKLLSLSALLIIGGYVIVDLAKTAGVELPGVLNLGNAVVAFTFVSFALLATADYGRQFRPLPVYARRMPFPRRRSIAAAHHHVYAIRRGVEAARLAPAPARVVVFPRNTPARQQRAA